MKSSKISSITSSGLASGLSILLIHTITERFISRAFCNTNLVWGITPSNASTTRITPLTILSTRSTSPPKSAWLGVSIMLILVSLYVIAVFLERIVIPLSLSISLESITRSATSWLALKVPLCFNSSSTRVVLPWSTWAIIAILRISSRFVFINNVLPELNSKYLLWLATFIFYHNILKKQY